MGFNFVVLFLWPIDWIGLDFYCLKYHFFRSHWSLLIFCHFGESLQSKTRRPCMLLLDSLEMGNPRRVEPDIRKYASKQTLPPCFSTVVYWFFWFLPDLCWTFIQQRAGLRIRTLFIEFLSWCLRWLQYMLLIDFHFNAIVFSLVFASGKKQWKKKTKSVQVPQQTNDEECGRFVLYFSKLFVEGAPEDFRIEDFPYFVSFHLLSCLLYEAPEHIFSDGINTFM